MGGKKAMTQKATRTDLSKTEKASPSHGSLAGAEAVEGAVQPARQEYPEVNAAIERGLADVAAGRVHTRCSFAEYANIVIEE